MKLRKCIFVVKLGAPEEPGYFHQWAVSFFNAKDGVTVSVHRAIVEDQSGRVRLLDPRNVRFENPVDVDE